MKIEGGISGRELDINKRNLVRTISASLSPQAYTAIFDSSTWTASDTQTPTGAADEFFYMRNDSQLYDIVISRLQFNAASVETITLAAVTGTAAGGTALTPVNRTITSGTPLNATIESGVDITGLTPGATLEIWEGTTSDQPIDLMNRPIILPYQAAVALSATTGAIAVFFAVDFYLQLAEPKTI